MKKLWLTTLVVLCAMQAVARADDYPSKPITMVNPGPPGGAIDSVARIIAEAMTNDLKQKVVMLNMDGAGGTIATARVAHAAPDGYTVLFHHIGIATAPALYKHLQYDTLKDLTPVGLTTEVPMVLLARKGFPPNTVAELVSYLKEQGKGILMATAGPGNVSELCASVLQRQLETNFTSVPYRGSPPALLDIEGDRVDFMCDQTSTAGPQITAKAVRAYGVAAKSRLPILSDVPTLTEQGLPFVFSIWQGVYVPAGTPEPIVKRLSESLQRALASETVKTKLAPLGVTTLDPSRATPAAHAAFLQEELKHWADIYKDTPKQ
jgi:tripartite-type tricarboxylate transporter receptor subunit TctC